MLIRQYAKTYNVDIPKSFECILEVLNDQVDEFRVSSIHSEKKSVQDKENSLGEGASNRSFQHDYVEMPKNSVKQDGGGGNRMSRTSQQQHQQQVMVQSRQSAGMGVIVMPSLSPNMRKTKQVYAGPLPIVNEGRPIIQHLHYPMVNNIHKSPIPIQVFVQPPQMGHFNSPSQATINRN